MKKFLSMQLKLWLAVLFLFSFCVPTNAFAQPSVDVSYERISSCKETFVGKIVLENTGTKDMYQWKMEFDFDGTILKVCNAKITDYKNNHYVLSGDKRNETIPAGKVLKILVCWEMGETKKDIQDIIVTDLSDEIAQRAESWNSYVTNTEAEKAKISMAEMLYFKYTRFEADMLYAMGYEHIVTNPVRAFTKAKYQNVEIKTPDGLKLKGLFFKVKKAKGTLIALHGRGDDMYNTIPHIEFLMKNGYQVLLFNARFWNYYEQPENYYGTMVEDVEDIGSALEYLKTRHDVDKNKIGLIGFSNGANKSIIAGSSFGDVKLVISNAPSAFPFFDTDEEICPSGWLYIRDEFMNLYCERYGCVIEDFKKSDALTCIGNITKPIMLVHGANDPYVNSAEITRLYNAANEPKEMYEFQNSGHCDEVLSQDKDDYVNKVVRFLDKYMGE